MREYAAIGNELFDLSDPTTALLYEKVKAYAKAEVIDRDTSSFHEIETGIQEAISYFSGSGLVILNGAYSHMIGAIIRTARLEQYNVRYAPIAHSTISVETPNLNGTVGENDIKIQMKRSLGVVKHFGFSDMEEVRFYLDSLPFDDRKATLTFFVENETGLHSIYSGDVYKKARRAAYDHLKNWVSKEKPSFIFSSREDLNVEAFKKRIENNRASTPFQTFIKDMMDMGSNVRIGAFGVKREPYSLREKLTAADTSQTAIDPELIKKFFQTIEKTPMTHSVPEKSVIHALRLPGES